MVLPIKSNRPGLIKRSWEMTKLSYSILKANKKLILFPVVSTSVLVALIAFLIGIGSILLPGPQFEIKLALFVLAGYFVAYLVIVFFNVALVSNILLVLTGKPVSFLRGISVAMLRFPQVIGWAAFAATIGLLLSLIESFFERFGLDLSGILGAAWSVLAYFTLPTLVIEGVGPFEAIKRSTQLLSKGWKEIIGGSVSFYLIAMLLSLPFAIVLAVFVSSMPDTFAGLFYLFAFILAVGVPYGLVVALIVGTLSAIFSTLLYAIVTNSEIDSSIDLEPLKAFLEAQKPLPKTWP